jgi:hypothetical protein
MMQSLRDTRKFATIRVIRVTIFSFHPVAFSLQPSAFSFFAFGWRSLLAATAVLVFPGASAYVFQMKPTGLAG